VNFTSCGRTKVFERLAFAASTRLYEFC